MQFYLGFAWWWRVRPTRKSGLELDSGQFTPGLRMSVRLPFAPMAITTMLLTRAPLMVSMDRTILSGAPL